MTILTQERLTMTQDHANVLNIIQSAEDKYISSSEILAKLNKESDYHRKLQQLISELVTDYNVPIGSSSINGRKGYFICRTPYDFHLAKRSLKSRREALKVRLDAIEECENNLMLEGNYERLDKNA